MKGHSRFGRKGTCEADHPEPVAPVAEVPGTQLLAMELAYVGIACRCSRALSRSCARSELPCDCQQFSFSTWASDSVLDHLGRLQQESSPANRLSEYPGNRPSRPRSLRPGGLAGVPPTWRAIHEAPSLKPRAR